MFLTVHLLMKVCETISYILFYCIETMTSFSFNCLCPFWKKINILSIYQTQFVKYSTNTKMLVLPMFLSKIAKNQTVYHTLLQITNQKKPEQNTDGIWIDTLSEYSCINKLIPINTQVNAASRIYGLVSMSFVTRWVIMSL